MTLKAKLIIKGFATFIPGIHRTPTKVTMGGNLTSRYCYSVWLRHLVLKYENNGMKIPQTIAEIGPGESLSTGLTAMLAGVNRYYAF